MARKTPGNLNSLMCARPERTGVMRMALAAITSLAMNAAFAADGFGGTKTDPFTSGTNTTTGSTGIMPFLQMLLALGIVIGLLKFVLPKMAGKLNKKLVPGLGSGIKIEESAAFAGGSLYIVQARKKTLLLSVSTNGVTCLSDLTDNEPEPPTEFEKIVEKEITAPMQPLAVANEDAVTAVPEDIQEKLDRLNRFTQ